MTAMSTTFTFDRLRYTDVLRNAGVDEKAARAHADALDDAMRQGVATKSDIAEVRTEIHDLRHELKTDIADLRHELKTDIAGLRTEFKTDMSSLETAVTRIIVEKHVAMLQWLAGGLTGLFVGIVAVIKLFK